MAVRALTPFCAPLMKQQGSTGEIRMEKLQDAECVKCASSDFDFDFDFVWLYILSLPAARLLRC